MFDRMTEQELKEYDARAAEAMRRFLEEQAARLAAEAEAGPMPTEIDVGLFRLLLVCAHRVSVEMMARIDVGESAMTVLVLLMLSSGSKRPGSVSDLAAELGCSRPAVTQLLNRMERRGLIGREVNALDGRRRSIVMTEKALNVWKTAHAPLCEVMRRMTGSFTKAQREDFWEHLKRLERDADHSRGMRAWSDAEPVRVEIRLPPETKREERELYERERVRRSAVHVR